MKKILNNELVRYVIVGVLTTAVSIGSYALLTKSLHIQYLVATIISWFAAVLFAYFTNSIFVFGNKSKSITEEITKMISFFSMRLASLGLEIGMMYIFVELLHINDLIVKIIANFLIVIINYLISKIFIFKKKTK